MCRRSADRTLLPSTANDRLWYLPATQRGEGAQEIERRRRRNRNSSFLWGCSGMKCGGLSGTRADKQVQIAKSERGPSHFFSYSLFMFFFSLFFFLCTPFDASSAVLWSNWIDCLGDSVNARRQRLISAWRHCLPLLVKRSSPSSHVNDINIELMPIVLC